MDHCLPQIQACRIRVCRLEPNGVPDPGPDNLYVSSALTELTVTPVYKEADEIEVVNACGDVCVNYKGEDNFKRLDVELTLCTPDPFLSELLGGGDVLTNLAGAKGYAYPAVGPVGGGAVSIELWTKRVTPDGDLDPEFPYAWWVLPKVKNLRHGVRSFENGAQLSVFSGQALENPNWYDGPTNDWPEDSSRVIQWLPTATLPAASCGYQELLAS